jgi:hypothetical protein
MLVQHRCCAREAIGHHETGRPDEVALGTIDSRPGNLAGELALVTRIREGQPGEDAGHVEGMVVQNWLWSWTTLHAGGRLASVL